MQKQKHSFWSFKVLKSLIDYKSSFFADPTPWIEPPVPSMWVYAMATSSSLLVVYLAVLFAMRIDFRARLARLCGGWKRLPQNETLILHTLPYYLAITRSSCEVTSQHSSQLRFTVSNSRLTSSTFPLGRTSQTLQKMWWRLETSCGNFMKTTQDGKHG